MGVISLKHKGSFKHSDNFFNRILKRDPYSRLAEYAQKGVNALSAATPIDSGNTANSWSYVINRSSNAISIEWKNSSQNEGIPIAILIQYGHATKDGGFVKGIDFINPALKPIFEEIADSIWKEVTAG